MKKLLLGLVAATAVAAPPPAWRPPAPATTAPPTTLRAIATANHIHNVQRTTNGIGWIRSGQTGNQIASAAGNHAPGRPLRHLPGFVRPDQQQRLTYHSTLRPGSRSRGRSWSIPVLDSPASDSIDGGQPVTTSAASRLSAREAGVPTAATPQTRASTNLGVLSTKSVLERNEFAPRRRRGRFCGVWGT